MTTVTDNVQNQMDAMNLTLGNLQNMLLRTLGVSEKEIESQSNCLQLGMAHTNNIHIGTKHVPLGGRGIL